MAVIHSETCHPDAMNPPCNAFLTLTGPSTPPFLTQLLGNRWTASSTGQPPPSAHALGCRPCASKPPPFWAMESLLKEFPISSAEGLALMRLAEALLACARCRNRDCADGGPAWAR
jgi:hypothetical protein